MFTLSIHSLSPDRGRALDLVVEFNEVSVRMVTDTHRDPDMSAELMHAALGLARLLRTRALVAQEIAKANADASAARGADNAMHRRVTR